MTEFTNDKTTIDCGGSKIVINKDGDISIIPKSGSKIVLNGNVTANGMSSSENVAVESTGLTNIKGNPITIESPLNNVNILSPNGEINLIADNEEYINLLGAGVTIGGNIYQRARYPNWVLVERKTLSAASETTFSNLDGNTDLAYFFRYSLSVPQTAVRDILITPNGNITSLQYVASHWVGYNGTAYEHGGAMGTNSGTNGLVLARGAHLTVFNPLYFEGETLLYPKTGRARRNCISNGMVWDSGPTMQYSIHSHSVWNEASTNITSLKVAPTGDTMTGFIELYKWKDGTIEL